MDALILKADKHITRSILTTAPLEDHNQTVHQKSEFLFGDTTPDTDQQLIAGEGQWIFSIKGEKYYLPSSRRHFQLSYFQSVTVPWKMKWAVTRFTDFVHIRILTLSGYNHCGSPRAVLDIHPGRVGQELPVGEKLAMAQTFLN